MKLTIDHKSLKELIVDSSEEKEQRIKEANQKIEEYIEKLEEQKLPEFTKKWEYCLMQYNLSGGSEKVKQVLIGMAAKWILRLILRGGTKYMIEEYLLLMLTTIMEKTEIDDMVFDEVAKKVKETIPGKKYEPIMGEVLVQIGTRLKATETTV